MKNKGTEEKMSKEFKIVRLGDVLKRQSKSTIKAGCGEKIGKYKFFTSSSEQTKYIDVCTYNQEAIILGTGGNANIHYCNEPFATSTDCFVYFAQDNVSVEAIYRYLSGNIHILQEGFKGAGLKHISKNYIEDIMLPLPSIENQQEIAAVLDKASELVEKRKAQLAELDLLAESVFYDMFGDPVINCKGWEMRTIEKLVVKDKSAIKRGPFGGALKKEIFVEDGYLVYEQFHALNNDFSFGRYFVNEEKYQELIGFAVAADDIIISCSGVNLGKLAIVPNGAKNGIINQALLKITLDNKIITNKLFVKIFTNGNFKEKYFGYNRGCAIPNFPPMSDFKQFKFICPPLPLQQQFVTRIEKIEEQKQKVKTALKESEDLFQRLMQDMFNSNTNI